LVQLCFLNIRTGGVQGITEESTEARRRDEQILIVTVWFGGLRVKKKKRAESLAQGDRLLFLHLCSLIAG